MGFGHVKTGWRQKNSKREDLEVRGGELYNVQNIWKLQVETENDEQ